jgi:hypothetical protein
MGTDKHGFKKTAEAGKTKHARAGEILDCGGKRSATPLLNQTNGLGWGFPGCQLDAVRPNFRGLDKIAGMPKGQFVVYNRDRGEELAGKLF